MTTLIPIVLPASSASFSGPNPGAVMFIIGILLMLLSVIVYLVNERFKYDGLEALSSVSFFIGAGMIVMISLVGLAVVIASLLGF